MFQFLVSAGVILLLVSGVLFLPGLVMLISGWLYKDSKMKERGLKFLAFAAVCAVVPVLPAGANRNCL